MLRRSLTPRISLMAALALAAAPFHAPATAADSAATSYDRFMKVKQWKLQWGVVWSGTGTDVVSDGTRSYGYAGSSGGSVDMPTDDELNPYFRTWRAAAGANANGGIQYDEKVQKPSGGTRTYSINSPAGGSYDSFPFSIDADRGIYNITIPCPSYYSLFQIDDE